MSKLIAKLLYPIYRELCEMRENQVRWDISIKQHNEQKESKAIQEAYAHGKPWWNYNLSESVSDDESQQRIVTGYREGGVQHPFIDR